MRTTTRFSLLTIAAVGKRERPCTAILGGFDFEGKPTGAGAGGTGGATSSTSNTGGGGSSTTTSSSSNTGGSVPACENRDEAGDETDVDCGGSCVAKCDDGKSCGVDDDCKSVNCFGGSCVSCSDGVKSGDETDVDCGGSCATKCADGETCAIDVDCVSVNCFGGACVSCTDGKQNGDETDKDCGGSCVAKCPDGGTCKVSGDCANVDCFGGLCISCGDGKKTGTETDVDCGGACSAKCSFGATCSVNADCASTYCVGGSCGALTVGTLSGYMRYVAVDPVNVYVVAGDLSVGGGNIYKIPVGGGSPTSVTYADNGMSSLAIDATTVYYVTGADVMKAPIAGGPPVKLATANYPGQIAVAFGNVYWANYGDGAVQRVGVFGGTVTNVVPASASGSRGIAVDGNSIYWTDFVLKTVSSVPREGGAIAVLANNQPGPFAIAASATDVFWLNGLGTGGLYKVPFGGGTPTELMSQGLADLALDASFAYVISGGSSGRIYRVPLAGGQVVVLADGLVGAENLAVDANYVYWTENSATTGYVKKIHK